LLLSWFICNGSALSAIHYVLPFKYIKKLSFVSADGRIFKKIRERFSIKIKCMAYQKHSDKLVVVKSKA